MKEYKIELQDSGKKTITYYINGEVELVEHYANKDGTIIGEIRQGYSKHPESL